MHYLFVCILYIIILCWIAFNTYYVSGIYCHLSNTLAPTGIPLLPFVKHMDTENVGSAAKVNSEHIEDGFRVPT